MFSKKLKIRLICWVISGFRFVTGKGSVDKVLVADSIKSIAIFSTTALGDFMFNTPAIIALKVKYPTANFTLVSSHKNKELVEGSQWFNCIIYWDQKVNSVFGVILALRKCKPDAVILLHSKSPYDVMCATLSGARYIFKDVYNENDIAMKRLVTSMTKHDFYGHVIERKLSLVEHLGCHSPSIEMQIPFIFNRPEKDDTALMVGFQLGASKIFRQWPVSSFQELARLLIGSGRNFRITLIGSPKEKELSRRFVAGMSETEQKFISDRVGDLSLSGLVQVISGFDILVTGDTGPLHLAVALRVKTVSLFVTAKPEHTGPLQDPHLHTVLRAIPDQHLLATTVQPMVIITPNEVMSAISEMTKN